MTIISGFDWSGDAGDPRKLPGRSPLLVTAVAHIEDLDWTALDSAMVRTRLRRNLPRSFVFHYSDSRESIRAAEFEEIRGVSFRAHALIPDKTIWPRTYIQQTSGDERTLEPIVTVVCRCPSELVENQVLLIDRPRAEMAKIVAARRRIDRQLSLAQRRPLRSVKPCPDHNASQGATVQLADMIAGAIRDSGRLGPPYPCSLGNKIVLL